MFRKTKGTLMTKVLKRLVDFKSAFSLLAMTIALLPGVPQAAPFPDYEPFNYTSGAILPGQVNPDGAPWTAAGPAGTDVRVEAGNLLVPGLVPPLGNRIVYQNILGPSARFNIFGI